MIESDPYAYPHHFGSSYDPVVHGVAHGLSALFPPIYLPDQAEEDRPIAKSDEIAVAAGDATGSEADRSEGAAVFS